MGLAQHRVLKHALNLRAGEVVLTGDHVLKGYLHGKCDRETKFEVDGERWHRTGDAGYFDKEGRLWLVGRCNVRIEDDKG
jgi:acyl-CoA synthetase (AMP-forming)/AMP-acid ligase II